MVSFRYYATIIIDRVERDIVNVMHVPASSVEYIVESENEDGEHTVYLKLRESEEVLELVDEAEYVVQQVNKENLGGKVTFSAS